MHQAGDILVAIHARKHPAVDGVFQLLPIHIQAHVLPVDLCGQGGITVAAKTIFIFELVLCAGHAGAGKQQEDECLSEVFSCGVHAYEKIPMHLKPQ
jgi:hypothetical protein